MNKAIKAVFGAMLSVMLFLSGCINSQNSQPEETTTQQITEAPTTAVPTASATADNPSSEIVYNYVAIKQKADEISDKFDEIVADAKFNGSIYMKLGNDFEYISTTGAADSNRHLDNSINTCFYTGDITAQFTATAVMMLVEEEKLSVDDTLDAFFPDYAYAQNITVKNLLNQTSGIKSYVVNTTAANESFALHGDIEKEITEDNSSDENKSIIQEWIFSTEPEFEAGTSFDYSESNYFLLGKIIEAKSGMTYEDFIIDKIFKPLGMNNSGFNRFDMLATAYDGNPSSEKLTYKGVGYSAFGLISNVSDLVKWVDAMLGNELVSKKSSAEMFASNENNYGYGIKVNGKRVSVSSGCDAYGSILVYTTDKSEIFVSLTNYYYSDPTYVHTIFRQYLTRFTE